MTQFKNKHGQIIKKCPTPIGYTRDQQGKFKNIRCKRWDCPYCSQINKKRVLDRVSNGFRDAQRVRMMTLTEDINNPQIMKDWARFRSLLANEGIKLKYFLGKEFTPESHFYKDKKTGKTKLTRGNVRHLHVLIDRYIDQELISKLWMRANKGHGSIVWINQADIMSSAGYISKYVTKTINNKLFGKHERRYSFSQKGGFVFDYVKMFEQYGFMPPKQITSIEFSPYPVMKGKFNIIPASNGVLPLFKRKKKRSEYTFHLGSPSLFDLYKTEHEVIISDTKGIIPEVPESEIVRYQKPYTWMGWHKYTELLIEYLYGMNYIQTPDMKFVVKSITSMINLKFDGIIQEHYVEHMIRRHNQKYS